jgi:hypothetical protein
VSLIEQLLEATDGHTSGYAGAARDCLRQAGECVPEYAAVWVEQAQAFAMLGILQELTTWMDVSL